MIGFACDADRAISDQSRLESDTSAIIGEPMEIKTCRLGIYAKRKKEERKRKSKINAATLAYGVCRVRSKQTTDSGSCAIA